MEINVASCKLLRTKLNEALAPIAKEFGMSFKVGGIRYSNTTMKTSVELNKIDPGVDPTDETIPYKADFKKYHRLYKLDETDLGLKDRDGNTFIGIASKRSKYPFVFQYPNGKIFMVQQTYMDGVKALNKR